MKIKTGGLSALFFSAGATAVAEGAEQGTLRCDDSKCLGPGIEVPKFARLGSCWAQDPAIIPWTPFAPNCADGYEVQPLGAALDGMFWYYSCCRPPSSPPNDRDVVPQCSDQVCASAGAGTGDEDCWADGPHEPMICDSDTYRYPRKTGAYYFSFSYWFSHYTCCDTPIGSSPPLKHSLVVAEGMRVALGCLAALCSLALILGIMSSCEARKRSYNLYLVGLAIADLSFAGITIATGSNSLSTRYTPCFARVALGYFYLSANVWLNTFIAHQVYVLLRNTNRRKRTAPPSLATIIKQMSFVYILATGFCIWGGLSVCGHVEGLEYNLEERQGRLTLALTLLCIFFVPFTYLTYISFRIWRGGLLPCTGRTRVLSLYFMRILLVFYILFIPAFFLLMFENRVESEGRLHYAAWYLASIQSVVSTAFALLKPDVRNAVLALLKCRYCNKDDGKGESDNETSSASDENISARKNWYMASRLGSSIYDRSSSLSFRHLSRSFSKIIPRLSKKQLAELQEDDDIKEEHDTDSVLSPDAQARGEQPKKKKRSNRLSWNMSSIEASSSDEEGEAPLKSRAEIASPKIESHENTCDETIGSTKDNIQGDACNGRSKENSIHGDDDIHSWDPEAPISNTGDDATCNSVFMTSEVNNDLEKGGRCSVEGSSSNSVETEKGSSQISTPCNNEESDGETSE